MSEPATGNVTLPLIRASELAEFGFCERAWWLSHVQQVASHNQRQLTRGQIAHTRHEQQVESAGRWSRISLWLFVVGGLLLLMALGLAVI